MEVKLFDSELKVMEVLWREGDLPAKKISDILKDETGWNMNTTYTVIKKCIAKGAVTRHEPKFVCHAEISRGEVQQYETDELVDKLYSGNRLSLVASLLGDKRLTKKELDDLRKMVEEMQ